MSMNLSAYVEKKNNETGKWELVTDTPISTRLKYIIDNYDNNPRVSWDELSDGLKEKYKKDSETGMVYGTFYETSLSELEDEVNSSLTKQFSKLNMIVKALGCCRMFSDDGEELEYFDDSNKKDKLTFQINKELIDDLQFAFHGIREVGQREALDLILSEYMGYDGEFRVILVFS